MYQKGRAWIEISLSSLKFNVDQLKKILPPECMLMPAVKANAYGHGGKLVSLALQEMGVEHFCVATAEEGIELRNAGILGEILVLGYTHPRQFELLLEYQLTQTVVDCGYAQKLQQHGAEFAVHIGIDTGMHRLGEDWENTDSIQKLWEYSNLKITGVFSHLCTADGRTKEEQEFTRLQIVRFQHVIQELKLAGKSGFTCHLQGSYGILNYPDCCFEYARPGIILYGIFSRHEKRNDIYLRPVLSLRTRVECIKELAPGETAGYGMAYTAEQKRKIAVLSIGYADGIPREIAGKAYVLCKGKKAPVIGRICMDQMLVDVTEIEHIYSDDEVVLIGQSGPEQVRAEDYAVWADTITNEVVSRLGQRLERILVF